MYNNENEGCIDQDLKEIDNKRFRSKNITL